MLRLHPLVDHGFEPDEITAEQGAVEDLVSEHGALQSGRGRASRCRARVSAPNIAHILSRSNTLAHLGYVVSGPRSCSARHQARGAPQDGPARVDRCRSIAYHRLACAMHDVSWLEDWYQVDVYRHVAIWAGAAP